MKLLLALVLLCVAHSAQAFESPAAYSARLEKACAWAPKNPAVCEGRNFCKANVRSARCAQYCNVNPYDVVCGEGYRPHYAPNSPAYNDSPYPWAHTPSYCEDHRNDIDCQEGFPWDSNF